MVSFNLGYISTTSPEYSCFHDMMSFLFCNFNWHITTHQLGLLFLFVTVIKNQCSFPGWSELQKTRRVLDDWCGSTICYQMPLERPPGGARMRADDLFGMWSSTCDPTWRAQVLPSVFSSLKLVYIKLSTMQISFNGDFFLPERLKEDSWRSRTPWCTRGAASLLVVSPSIGPKPSSFFIKLATLATSPE